MRRDFAVLTGVSIMALLITTSLALFYRSQAICFQRECKEAMDRLGRMPTVSATPEPAALREEIVLETLTAHGESSPGRFPGPSRDPDPKAVEEDKPMSVAGVTTPPRASEQDRFRRRSSDWMENLRTNDPQRYAEFQARRQEMQQSLETARVQAADYFMNRDTSKMTRPELEEYNTMILLLDQTWALNQQLQSGLPPDARQQVMANIRSNIVVVAPLIEKERDKEYYDMAVAMGQSERDAATMVGYINRITSNTSLRAILPGIRRGGMPGGGAWPRGNYPSDR